MIKILHNSRCSKSRDSFNYLTEKGIDFEVREYLKEPLTEEELRTIISKLGISPIELIRKGEAIYKENYKGKELSDDEWISAMVEYPKLIERPIVVKGEKAVIGRPLDNVVELLK